MKDYNHRQFIDWLKDEVKEETSENKLLVEAKLSKYWKARAKRRALKANRKWPNKHDRDWALTEQNKSENINEKIHALFQKELEESEDISEVAKDMMNRMKRQIKKLKLQREAAKLLNPKDRPKIKKQLSKSPPKNTGKVADRVKKSAKHYNSPVVAPMESPPGGIVEEKKNENK